MPDRPAAVKVGDHGQIAPVHRIEAQPVDFEPGQRPVGHSGVDRVGPRRMGEIAHAAKQPAGNSRGAAAAAGDLMFAFARGRGAQQTGHRD